MRSDALLGGSHASGAVSLAPGMRSFLDLPMRGSNLQSLSGRQTCRSKDRLRIRFKYPRTGTPVKQGLSSDSLAVNKHLYSYGTGTLTDAVGAPNCPRRRDPGARGAG